jgi:dihydropteroate synthase
VIEALADQVDVPLSIDTSKPAVARGALAAGAEIINDVTGLIDSAMIEIATRFDAAVCVMHMLGTPRTMQDDPVYDDVVADVIGFLGRRRDVLMSAGVEQDRIALDPGIGFGKNLQHNLRLLRSIERFHELGCPVLVGHSRKRFIGEVLGDAEADRTAGTIGVALATSRRGPHILRVHDVAAVRQALLLFEAAGGMER